MLDGTDEIRLTGLQATGYHGYFEHERRQGQTFSVDVTLSGDLRLPGRSDLLEDTVNYAQIAEIVHARITGDPFDLIEALAESIAGDVLALSPEKPLAVQVRVHKPHAPIPRDFADVSVCVRRRRPVPVVLALGSNLGDSGGTLAEALEQLRTVEGLDVLSVSDVARTKPVGGPAGQPDYLNLVLTAETMLEPLSLLEATQRIENRHGRVREVRWGARTLDIDIITYGQLSMETERLTLPHPRAKDRAFVLAPWSWAEPSAELPGVGPVEELLQLAQDLDDVERIGTVESVRVR